MIPTLQRSDDLDRIVAQCEQHPCVLEVLVINNAEAPLTWSSDKVRVLNMGENTYVNPAWNLGAREARGDLLALINDDVLFDDRALSLAARTLRWGIYGVIGPSADSFNRPQSGRPRVRVAPFFSFKGNFGTFMCMRTRDYVPVPEQMRIWGGDDWLFLQQRRPNGVISGLRFDTDMGTTSGSPEFQQMRDNERAIARTVLMPLYRTRWWHRPVEYVDRIRSLRRRSRR